MYASKEPGQDLGYPGLFDCGMFVVDVPCVLLCSTVCIVL